MFLNSLSCMFSKPSFYSHLNIPVSETCKTPPLKLPRIICSIAHGASRPLLTKAAGMWGVFWVEAAAFLPEHFFCFVGNSEAKTRRLLGIFSRVLYWERTAVIKSLTKAVMHCSLYTFRGQCLGMETKHLGDVLKQSMQMKYSGIATCPI